MSVRDYAVLYLGGKPASRDTAGGGNVLLSSGGPHRLDGPEHTLASDSTTLDASTTEHGLLPKLPGDDSLSLLGDGSWGTPAGVGLVPYFIAPAETFKVPEFRQALYEMAIDNEGVLDVEGYLLEVD